MSRTRILLLWATLGFYALIVAAVCGTTWLVRLDWQLMLFRPYKQWPEYHAFLDYFVVLGQRGPTAVLIAAWLSWRCWRQRTIRPLLVLVTALLLLNVSVGAAKLGMAREGPHYANVIGSNEMWRSGDIFPSGHTANAVVTWGILAYLATTPRARRTLSVIAAVFALSVGATTVYIGTHWVSDVLLGWAAGLLVLLALPWCEPMIARTERMLLALRERLRRAMATDPDGWSHGRSEGGEPLPPFEMPVPATAGATTAGPRGEPAVAPAGSVAATGQQRLRQPGTAHPAHAARPALPSRPARPVGSR